MRVTNNLQSYGNAFLNLHQTASSSTDNLETSSMSVQGYSEYVTLQVKSIVELCNIAMDAMGVSEKSRVTFSQITKYRNTLEREYASILQQQMANAGIDTNIEFSLQSNDEGRLTVIGKGENITQLQSIFDNNMELQQKYKQLEALSNLDRARSSLHISNDDLKSRLQIESIASWWSSSGNSGKGSSFANYSAKSMNLLSGIDVSV